MKTQTQQSDVGQQMQQAVLQAAFDADPIEVPTFVPTDPEVNKNGEKTQKTGLQGAGPGRPKGVRNKLTNLRDAVIEAFDRVGGADYLVRLAEGTQSDRAAFVSLMNKVLPTQVNANVEGGIKLELSWLSARSIGGTSSAQSLSNSKQVIDLERDSEGGYRIKHPSEPSQPEIHEPGRDPLPPQDRQGGVGQG